MIICIYIAGLKTPSRLPSSEGRNAGRMQCTSRWRRSWRKYFVRYYNEGLSSGVSRYPANYKKSSPLSGHIETPQKWAYQIRHACRPSVHKNVLTDFHKFVYRGALPESANVLNFWLNGTRHTKASTHVSARIWGLTRERCFGEEGCSDERMKHTFLCPTHFSVMTHAWIGKGLEGGGRGLTEMLSWHLPGGVRTACVPAAIRTGHLMNTSLER